MASNALEEKINKIKLQNEEIRRRYEEVEADKKNAAKLNALVKMVPSDNWPERKEPPEFSAPVKIVQKQKTLNKEHNDRIPQHYSGIQDRSGKKDHKFAQGDGPPPDPKYNFLADSEREIRITDNGRIDEGKNRPRNKALRGASKKKDNGGGSKEAYFKDNRGPHAFYSKDDALPEYEAWRAERNKIDEARINRQKTAEGNWRREWDSNKTNVEKESLRKGDMNRKDSNNYERRNNNHYNGDYTSRGHGAIRTYHGAQKNHNNQDYRRSHYEQAHEYKKQLDSKPALSPTDERTVTVTDKSIKVTLNHGIQSKAPVMSVKVNSPSIAGTGRVGPRQKSRVTYSSQLDADPMIHESSNFSRQKSFDEKTIGSSFNSGQKLTSKNSFSQRKKESNIKSPFTQRKEFKNDEYSTFTKNAIKTSSFQKNETRDQKQFSNYTSKVRAQKRSQKFLINKNESFSISDEAIPSEYNPDKSFNNHDGFKKEVVIENDNFEKAFNETDNISDNFSDESKNINDFIINDKSTDQNEYFNSIENTVYLNSDKIQSEVNNINKHIEIYESIKSFETNVGNDKNFEQEMAKNIECLKKINCIEKDEDDNIEKSYENIDKNITNVENFNNIIQNMVEKKNEISLPNFNNEGVEQNHNLCDIKNDTIELSPSEIVKEIGSIRNCENTEGKTNELEQNADETKIINHEFEHIQNFYTDFALVNESIDNNKNKINALQEQNLIQLNISQKESIDNSNLLEDNNTSNELIILRESEAVELIDLEKKPANDSGFIDDFDKLQNTFNTSIIESNDENNIEKNLQIPVTSNSIELTKLCEKNIEICDIHSAAFDETPKVIECYPESINTRINNEEINNVLENHTKDNEVHLVQNINNSLESLKNIEEQEIKQNEMKHEFSVKEQSTNVTVEATVITASDELTEVDSNELMQVNFDKFKKINSEERIQDNSVESIEPNSNKLVQVVSDKSIEDVFDELKEG